LRGINVGGNKKVPMSDLKNAFEELGFTDVKTLLNSGNVAFSSNEKDTRLTAQKIEDKLELTFGFKIPVIVRTGEEIKSLVNFDPFKNIKVTPETRLYVTFLSEKSVSDLKIPYESSEKNFKILLVSDLAIFSVLTLSEKYNTTDAMKIIENEYGKKVTTRNWNTVKKLAAL
jgi:uncharacterized protein (DUF1697 family)